MESARAKALTLSTGTETGPPIGAEKGPLPMGGNGGAKVCHGSGVMVALRAA
jgi:hypothetical protein